MSIYIDRVSLYFLCGILCGSLLRFDKMLFFFFFWRSCGLSFEWHKLHVFMAWLWQDGCRYDTNLEKPKKVFYIESISRALSYCLLLFVVYYYYLFSCVLLLDPACSGRSAVTTARPVSVSGLVFCFFFYEALCSINPSCKRYSTRALRYWRYVNCTLMW